MKLYRKLIDPKLLMEDLGEEPYVWTDTDAEIQEHSDWLRFKEMIERQPTVDAVEVVHCKDCKHCYKSYGSSTGYRCKVWGIYDTDCEVTPEHYCSYGERKDND